MNAEDLAKAIIENYDNPLQGSTIDVPAHVESLLHGLGATTSDSGGRVTYYGSDPITPDRLPYGSISAISLAAKAILIAKIWKERTGDYATKTAGSNDEHLYPDPEGFVVDTPMGRYTGVTEMVEMSKTPGEYKHPLTPLGSWQPSWL